MLSVQDDDNDVDFVYWDGAGWGAPIELETNTVEDKNQPFLFLWDRDSASMGNHRPVLSAIGSQSANEGENLNFEVSATDAESVPVLSTSSLPGGASFVDNADGTGVFDFNHNAKANIVHFLPGGIA